MTRLRDVLKNKSEGYYGRLNQLEREADAILPDIREVFPGYTNHDNLHKKGVEEILDNMIPDSIKNDLKPAEIFYLLVATWFHDVGMILTDEKEKKEFNESKEEIREKIRDQHHIRSYNYILKNSLDLNLDGKEANAIANICKSHRKINITEEVEDPIHGGSRIRLRFLGACLRLADECHVTEDRISRLTLEKINKSSWEFRKHFKKHELVSGILFNENNDKTIKIGAYVETTEDEVILEGIKDKIQEELDSIKEIFKENGLPLKSVVLDLNRDELIKKNIILSLSEDKKDFEKVSSDIKENSGILKANLKSLKTDKFIKIEDLTYKILENIEVFKKILNMFAGDQRSLNFIKSKYGQKLIEKKLLSYLTKQYNIIYEIGESQPRIEILKNSPTAVYLALYGKKLLKNPYLNSSLIQGDIVLDQMLLLGLSYDIFKYSSSIELDINNVIESITSKTKIRIPELFELYKEV